MQLHSDFHPKQAEEASLLSRMEEQVEDFHRKE